MVQYLEMERCITEVGDLEKGRTEMRWQGHRTENGMRIVRNRDGFETELRLKWWSWARK